MKATKIISACAVLVALASCSNDLSQPTAEDTPIRIQANVGGITTRAAHNLLSSFGSGDAINVYITENTTANSGKTSGANYSPTVYTHNGSQFNTTTPQYFPSNGNGIDVWAVYPSTVTESSNTYFTIESNQTSDTDYKNSDLMFAQKLENKTKTDDITLSFSHQLSKIIVKLEKEGGVDGVLDGATIKLTNVIKKIALTSVDGSGITLGNLSSVQEDKGELTIGKYATNGAAAIVIPQSASSMKFKVELDNGGSYTADMPNTTTQFEPNKEYTFTLTLKANAITVSASIKAWAQTDGGSSDATLD